MRYLKTQSKVLLHALAAMLLLVTVAPAQIAGLCNTGQTQATASGCTGVLLPATPNAYGTPQLDGNWEIAYPYPSTLSGNDHNPCLQEKFLQAIVDTPNANWFANSVSAASEWIMPDGGGGYVLPLGWYILRTKFPVPAALPGGGVPKGLTINGHLASDNAAYWIYLQSPNSAGCGLVSGQSFPVNPIGGATFTQWWPFSFTNSRPITPGSDAYLYIVMWNGTGIYNGSSTGLRVEFFASSSFN